jgi:hypothetical protein
VVFTEEQGATKTVQALHGRWFGGRQISAEYIDPEKARSSEG